MATKIIETISTVTGWLSGIGVYVMVIAVFIEVVMRYFFNSSIYIAEELSVYCMIFVSFLGAAMTMKNGAHIKVDLLYKRLSPKARLWLDVVTTILGTIICIIVTYQCIQWVIYTYKTDFVSPSVMETPMWIPMSAIPIGMFLWTLQYMVETIKTLRRLVGKD